VVGGVAYDAAMPLPKRSSRRRFRDYLAKVRERRAKRHGAAGAADDVGPAAMAGDHHGDPNKNRKPRSRPFLRLLGSFWGLLAGHRGRLAATLLALSFSTLLGLIPLYGTKIVFDGVL
jgi:hypothetical protein